MNHPDIDMTSVWTKQLYREFEEINWYHKLGLRPCVIQITELGHRRWGQWDPFFRTITLNHKLITDHRWDIVLEILKHEMAHQYVSEILGLPEDNTHGQAFAAACARVGIAGWAAKASGELPEHIPTLRERVLSQDDEKLLQKVEKLLALAGSTNEHESLLAMQKVRELYTKHNFDRLRAHRSGNMDSLIICRRRKKMEPHESMIYAILNESFFVKVVHTGLFDAKTCEKYKAVELLGTRENLLMAEYVFYFLLHQCDALWRDHKGKTNCTGKLKRSYQLGILHGFSEKLAAQPVQQNAAEDLGLSANQALVLLKQDRKELNDFVGIKYPRLSSKSRGQARVDGGTFAAGKSAGKSLNLHRAVTGRSSRFGGFLT